ncbi:UDP-2,3-diacylglucosamine hydrolase [Shewanella sp. OPT22]|nr:UDP-2,3-diacylglucosamine hydrolase [Shewanella sp. OPT22]
MTFSSTAHEQGQILKAKHYHAFWLSDIHLGCKDCKAEFLLQLLQTSTFDNLYLVGDIIDLWALKKRPYWPESHHKVLQKIIEIAQSDTNVIFIPGNHDELLKSYHYFNFANIEIHPFFLHHAVSGKKLLMVHGDQFDSEVCVSRYYAKLGDHLYDLLLFLNRSIHRLRKRFGHSYWSLASYIKKKVPKAQQAINRYHQAAIRYAKQQNVDAIFCGHIHQPELIQQENIIYGNHGDWIENCTLIAETEQGELQLLQWDDKWNCTRVLSQIDSSIQVLSPNKNTQQQPHESVA